MLLRTNLSLRLSVPILVLGCGMACAKTQPPISSELALVVTSPVAPGLKKPGSQVSDCTVHQGDVLFAPEKIGLSRWNSPLEGKPVVRDSEMLRARRNLLAPPLAVFDSDVVQTQIPSSDWLCRMLGDPIWVGSPCRDTVLRIQVPDGRSVAFFSGGDAPCPLTVVSARGIESTRVEGITSVQLAHWEATTALLVVSQWLREAGWSGIDLIVFQLDPALRRVAAIRLVEADPRNAHTLRWQTATWQIVEDGLRVNGVRNAVNRSTGERFESIEYRDHWGFLPGGRMVRAPD
jgi:hypothetical protein